MTLIKSISGIRGTIGGVSGEGLSPLDIVKFTAAYASFIKQRGATDSKKIVVGRDARISGEMVSHLVMGTLMGMGLDVVDIGLATTPTTEVAVANEKACGGIILTASHNPKQWNALKLLNEKGEFLSAKEGEEILRIADNETEIHFSEVETLGHCQQNDTYDDFHIQSVVSLPLVDVEAIKQAGFTVAIDCVNSVGGIIIPKLLDALGVKQVVRLYCEPNGLFPHNPEPLPEHLSDISQAVKDQAADVGLVVDPDVDRLAIVCENGEMFGEEYTLVAVADYVLSNTPGNSASNLSSSRALRDVTIQHGGIYEAAAVGEVNVVEKMKEIGAVIGGEGNGGVIYPESHYGRDALVGIALFLTHLAKKGVKASKLRNSYPAYFMAKEKIELNPSLDVDAILAAMKVRYAEHRITDIDGVKIDFPESWVHLRKSNTEPIIRIYSEAGSQSDALQLAKDIKIVIEELSR